MGEAGVLGGADFYGTGIFSSSTTRRHDSNGRYRKVSPSERFRVTIYRTHGSGDAFANQPEIYYANTPAEAKEIVQDRTLVLRERNYAWIDSEVNIWDPKRERYA